MQRSTLEKTADEDLVLAALGGDSEAEDVLLSRYKRYVKMKASAYNEATGLDRDDLVQEGMIGLFGAVRRYDSSRGASFKTYADRCISARLINALRSASRLKHSPLNSAVSLHKPLDDGSGETLADILAAGPEADPEEIAAAAELEEILNAENGKLFSELERNVFKRLREGKDYKEIALELGKSNKTIDNTIQRIRNKIKNII